MSATEHFWNIIIVAQTLFISILRQLPTFDFMVIMVLEQMQKYNIVLSCS